MDDHLLFPQATGVLCEAIDRHLDALSYCHEAIDLAHLAWGKERDFAVQRIPGVPSVRRARNDVNDNVWRYLRLIGEPLVLDGRIRSFETIEGGDVMILNDGMHVRIKKADEYGRTSNYPTSRVRSLGLASTEALFSGVSPLDKAIQDGVVFDLAYIAGEALGEYTQVGLRFAVVEASPFIGVEPLPAAILESISPTAFELVAEARTRLVS